MGFREWWKDLGLWKKGALIGIIIGLLFGIYSNFTTCHTSPGGPSGCENKLQLYIAVFELFICIIPAAFLSLIPGIADSVRFRIILLFSPLIFFGLLGILIIKFTGLVLRAIKKRKKQ